MENHGGLFVSRSELPAAIMIRHDVKRSNRFVIYVKSGALCEPTDQTTIAELK